MSKLRLQKENIALVQAFKSNDMKRFHELLKKKSVKQPKQLHQPSSDNVSPTSSSSSVPILSSSPSSSPLAVHHTLASSSSSSSSSTFYYPNINDYDEHRQTCLHVACTNGSSDQVRELLGMGADANAVDDRLWTPLHCALANGHLEAAKALLIEGTGSVNVNHANESGSSPLHYLARHTTLSAAEEALWGEVFLLLSRMGAQVNLANAHGITPLHDACATGATDKVKPLVRKGADVHATNKYYIFYPSSHSRFGETPLHYAVKSGVLDTIGYLLYIGADPYKESERGNCFDLALLYHPKSSGMHIFLSGIKCLPEILFLQICSFLTVRDWCNMMQDGSLTLYSVLRIGMKVCTTFARMCSHDVLWKRVWDQNPRLRAVRIKTDEFSYKELVSDWYNGKWDEWLSTSPINEKPELAAKILLVGDASVGKTAFLTQFMGRAPKGKLDDTTSMDRTIFMHGKQITLHLYELSLARNTNRGKSPYRGMNGVVLFYSSNDVDSFANLHLWLEDVRRFSEKLPVVVVGTHYDMPSPLVERDQTKKFSKEHQVLVFETGKGMGHNVQLSLRMVAEAIHDQYVQRSGARPGVAPLTKGVLYHPFC
ncbi:Ras subfamily protein [Acanthamoeba castellanii str. Neff]|uniref:Ras subfamily protein n=1 Tax=Acanthamoeba castellanii (strain ATCC 30010 / Neff) TaxID=1257118 RepID=L8GVQ5_ACACF|nr:Ras subfamily protein [Acanthamoeba castellanii str. Neff]ELR16673.1 Ras subfamily protein [Acanthamoeba castellanii str. Neff]